ncbi:MAG: ATP-binding cassette domain-containing protein [Acidobacteriaceae bacterium]|nr:ATP-binding cassette domain-containing protein [Acidobacteriaceae bacterium]
MKATAAAIDARITKRLPPDRLSAPFDLDIHLELPPGTTALFGPSGAGKSLTLNCLAGFAKPDAGRILVKEKIFFDAATGVCLPPEQRRCGYVFQDHALFPHMSVRDNLRFAAASANSSRRTLEQHRRINELLETFELKDLALRKPSQLSGGQKQRAALARILASDPRLLLLDEPTRGLDSRLRVSFYEILVATRKRLQAPIVLVTHDLEECFQLAETVCLMDEGRVLQSGCKNDILHKPASVQAARILGLHNLMPAKIVHLDPGRNIGRLSVPGGEIEGPYFPGHLIGDAGFACIKKTDVAVNAPSTTRSKNSLILRVLNADTSPGGVRIDFQGDISATVSEQEFRKLRDFQELSVKVDGAAVQFIGK